MEFGIEFKLASIVYMMDRLLCLITYVSLREKSMGKAVPTSATATAPAMRYVLPSAATSPTAETATSRPRPAGQLAVALLIVIVDGAAPRGPAAEQQRAVAGAALTTAAIVATS